jgi:hypothetical protein
MEAFINDLRYAHTVGRAVEVHLLSGETIALTDLRGYDEEAGVVNLHAPQHFGDDTTTRKVALDVIASVTVTDVQV